MMAMHLELGAACDGMEQQRLEEMEAAVGILNDALPIIFSMHGKQILSIVALLNITILMNIALVVQRFVGFKFNVFFFIKHFLPD